MKKENVILTVSGIIVILGGYMIYKKLKSTTNDSVPELATPPIVDFDKLSIPDKDLVLSLGSRGTEVKALQTALKNLVPDGIFGVLTLARLKAITGLSQISLNQYNDFVTKQTDATFIVGSGKHKSVSTIIKFEADFLKAWADAIRAVQKTFEYNGKNYSTQGGTTTALPKEGTFVVNGVTYRTSDGSIVK